ncbi:YhdT family protein [Photobacterium sp. 1_MG-2023]|uniref:YhdT family protein n=1 Tax=Photobacterium sp. 1_MG-2023 TaxID=3062646 RepID=UPI0026E34CCA|nr:YhdT family protein [Photobacterium sp. 1_MG-2023]MDO6707867.1 YhdT family protein [Photobacterium sp. 1_MG-2023]
MKTLSTRYRQAHKEARWALGLAVAYFLWWYCTAYYVAPEPAQDILPELYWGLPLWFVLACIVGPALFTLLCALMVKFIYQDMPLSADTEDDHA